MKIQDIHMRDPFIMPCDGKYYLYGTRGKNAWETNGSLGFDVYISEDLINWSDPISVFEEFPGFWGTMNFWAPEVHEYKGKFYMFATFKNENCCRGTQILIADTPEGPFMPHSDDAITPHDWECLDGTLYIAKDGKPYIVFCHEWVQVGNGEMCALELTDDLKHAVGEPRILFRAHDPVWSVCPSDWAAQDNLVAYVTDGPFLYRGETGKLYMLWSSFAETGYVQAVAVSDNDDIDGNWSHEHPLLMEKDGGHGMLFTDCNGQLHLTLHAPNEHPAERPILYDVVEENGVLKRIEA